MNQYVNICIKTQEAVIGTADLYASYSKLLSEVMEWLQGFEGATKLECALEDESSMLDLSHRTYLALTRLHRRKQCIAELTCADAFNTLHKISRDEGRVPLQEFSISDSIKGWKHLGGLLASILNIECSDLQIQLDVVMQTVKMCQMNFHTDALKVNTVLALIKK